MIAANYDRRFDFAALDQLVHGHTKLGALAITKPADARGQSLKLNAFFRQFHPARQCLVLRKQFECELIGPRDVLRIAAQRHPTERTFPFAKKRTDVFRNEPGNVERIFNTGLLRLGANVVPVIERDRAFLLQREHRFDVHGHRLHRLFNVLVGILRS